MKLIKFVVIVVTVFSFTVAIAEIKPCEELKAEIEKLLEGAAGIS